SPSRKVVSKMTTRSLSDWVGVVMERFLLSGKRAAMGALGVRSAHPLSAQAQMPVRPSGAGKQKERPKNEGGTGGGAPGDRAAIAANRHCLKIPRRLPGSRRSMNVALTQGRTGFLIRDGGPKQG